MGSPTAEGLAACCMVGSGERNPLPLLPLAPRVFRMQMLFESQVDEPARPCTLPVSTYIMSVIAVDKYTVEASPAEGAWEPGPPGPFGRPSWGWLIGFDGL